jgi:hypothetical protein
VLESVHIAANKNTVPGDVSAMVPGGIRMGTVSACNVLIWIYWWIYNYILIKVAFVIQEHLLSHRGDLSRAILKKLPNTLMWQSK